MRGVLDQRFGGIFSEILWRHGLRKSGEEWRVSCEKDVIDVVALILKIVL